MPISIAINDDCMNYMKTIPDKYFELAICDPPYGINMSQELHRRGISCKKNHYKFYELKEWDNKKPDKKYFDELFRISKNQIIWGANYFLEYLKSGKNIIIWNKMNEGFSFADGEMAWGSFDKSLRIFNYTRGYTNRIHPTQKPIALYIWLLQNYAKKGDKIFDSHLGSGSSRIACYELGFDFIGVELDKDYFEAQEKRFVLEKARIDNKFYIPESSNDLFKDVK